MAALSPDYALFYRDYMLDALRREQPITTRVIHHRGQLSMYLRPMGAKVPSIYGESYDSAQARQARA